MRSNMNYRWPGKECSYIQKMVKIVVKMIVCQFDESMRVKTLISSSSREKRMAKEVWIIGCRTFLNESKF